MYWKLRHLYWNYFMSHEIVGFAFNLRTHFLLMVQWTQCFLLFYQRTSEKLASSLCQDTFLTCLQKAMHLIDSLIMQFYFWICISKDECLLISQRKPKGPQQNQCAQRRHNWQIQGIIWLSFMTLMGFCDKYSKNAIIYWESFSASKTFQTDGIWSKFVVGFSLNHFFFSFFQVASFFFICFCSNKFAYKTYRRSYSYHKIPQSLKYHWKLYRRIYFRKYFVYHALVFNCSGNRTLLLDILSALI